MYTLSLSLSERPRLTVAELNNELWTVHQIRMKAVCHRKFRPAIYCVLFPNNPHSEH
jgi:hypothetical protein